MNEKIEELFPKNSCFDDNHTVNTNEIVPEQIEVIAVNEYGKVIFDKNAFIRCNRYFKRQL